MDYKSFNLLLSIASLFNPLFYFFLSILFSPKHPSGICDIIPIFITKVNLMPLNAPNSFDFSDTFYRDRITTNTNARKAFR